MYVSNCAECRRGCSMRPASALPWYGDPRSAHLRRDLRLEDVDAVGRPHEGHVLEERRGVLPPQRIDLGREAAREGGG